MRKYITHLLLILLLVLVACNPKGTSTKYNDDAVRIKSDYMQLYDTITLQNKLIHRNGASLRGEVKRIVENITITIDSCKGKIDTNSTGYVEFLDSTNFTSNRPQLEKIPISRIDFVGEKKGLNLGKNWFENYNDPLNAKNIREVPYIPNVSFVRNCDTIQKSNDSTPTQPPPIDCGCEPYSYSLGLECGKRTYSDIFVEVRGGYAAYIDKLSLLTTGKAVEGYMSEIAAGYRFGENKQWGIGLAYGTGVGIANTYDESVVTRPWLMLHGRKNFDRILCISPFVYGQFGMSLDKASLDLFNFKYGDCKTQITDPSYNVNLPISYGIGAGLDIPVLEELDLSIDLGYKHLNVGEYLPISGFANVPFNKTIDMFVLRLGLTY